MVMLENHDIVPVVMFHSIGCENTDWVYSYISEPINTFKQKIELLYKKKYNFIFWNDLYQHMAGYRKLPPRSIMLTFDDGYLDNWIYAFPILKRYNAKATIFVNPEFVDPSTIIRQRIDDLTDLNSPNNNFSKLGFLNWPEMKLMEESGLIDIQSHALTHTWYYSSEKLIDFIKPNEKKYPWLFWNDYPERKPFYMTTNYSDKIQLGTPVYEYEKSLICNRFFPSRNIKKKIIEYVKEEGEGFFKKETWRNNLEGYHKKLLVKYKNESSYENDDSKFRRILDELKLSKSIIDNNLNKNVEFVCWPGGGYDETVCNAAKLAGYKAYTISMKHETNFRNKYKSNPQHIKRIPSYHWYKGNKGVRYGLARKGLFYYGLKTHKGSLFGKIVFKILKLFGIILSIFKHKLKCFN